MGGALLGGLLRSGWAGVGDVTVVEPVAERRDELAAEHPGLRIVAAPEPGCSTTPASGSPARCWP